MLYQSFLWKSAYAAVHGIKTCQNYVDAGGKSIQNGNQLFMS